MLIVFIGRTSNLLTKAGSASVILTASASETRQAVATGSASVIIRAAGSGFHGLDRDAIASVVLVASAGASLVPAVNPGLGRTFRTPHVRIYNLDSMHVVDVVNLAHLRYARVGQVYSLPLRLSTRYPVGRYGVLYQSPVGSFLGVSLGIFEVVANGDGAGPVIAAYTMAESTGDLVLGQLGSGAIVVGQKPGVV